MQIYAVWRETKRGRGGVLSLDHMCRLFTLLILCSCCYAQRMSLGVLGGFSPTDAFQDRTGNSRPPRTSPVLTHAYSESKDFLAGAALEIHIHRAWSVELNGIFRQMHLTQTGTRTADGGIEFNNETPVVTWEFPLLAKYRLPGAGARPFVEAGPAFRTIGNLNGTSPSQLGAAIGAGVEIPWRGLRFSPTLRYTRWKADDPAYAPTLSNSNQIELLFAVTGAPESPAKPLGRRASVGIIAGTNLTGDVRRQALQYSIEIPRGNVFSITQAETNGPRRLLIGPSFEFDLPRQLSLEIDALYRRISVAVKNSVEGTPPPFYPVPQDREFNYITWEFPVLLKYGFRMGQMRPFFGAGPVFRRPQSLTTPSPYGAVAAVGTDVRWWRMRVSPGVRFVHWGRDRSTAADYPVRRNQSEILVGFSF